MTNNAQTTIHKTSEKYELYDIVSRVSGPHVQIESIIDNDPTSNGPLL